MAYFNHAFHKVLVATKDSDNFLKTAGIRGVNLPSGQLAAMVDRTNDSITYPIHRSLAFDMDSSALYGEVPQIYLAQGSFAPNDKIGKFHGGYQESVKSKGINPKYVSQFYLTEPGEAQQEIIAICADACELECETTYHLRLDVKGSPVLRFMNRNGYFTASGYTGCCDDTENPSVVDPNVVLLQWADQINKNELVNPFVNAYVIQPATDEMLATPFSENTMNVDDGAFELEDGMVIQHILATPTSTRLIPWGSTIENVEQDYDTGEWSFDIIDPNGDDVEVSGLDPFNVVFWDILTTDTYTPVTTDVDQINGCLILVGAYEDTKWGDCSFEPKDKFDIEPVRVYASVVDMEGDPCVTSCFDVSKIQGGLQGKGYGETLLRELNLFKSYRQDYRNCDIRLREVMGDTLLDEISRDSKYYVYHILHSVPRKSNPDGTMDNDQYLVKIVTPARDTDFENFIEDYCASAGHSGIELQVIV